MGVPRHRRGGGFTAPPYPNKPTLLNSGSVQSFSAPQARYPASVTIAARPPSLPQ